MKKFIFLTFTVFILFSCGKKDIDINKSLTLPDTTDELQALFTDFQIPLAWDNKVESSEWNKYVHEAILKYGANLLSVRPNDISEFSINFDTFNKSEKINFWSYILSALAKKESNHNPKTFYQENFNDSTGKPVISRGLLQISYASSKLYKCPIKKDLDLHVPKLNITCGIMIMNRWIGQDKRITNAPGTKNWRGMARYWSVMRRPHKSFAFVRDSTSAQF